jgi:phosphate transport system substrate-binding protein
MIRSAFSKVSLVLAGALVAIAAIAVADTAVHVDSKLMPYKTVSGVSGNIKAVGSDTMNNLMTLWAEDFRKVYPNVQVEIEGKGSSTAPPALVEGTATFGPMSRTMKDEEVDQFEAKYGYKPTAIRTSIDMLSIYVSKDNPIKSLTMQQVDAIFSKTRKGGAPNDIRTWGDLGLTGEWKDKPISLYGRNSASGTYGYFKEHALFKGDYKDEVKEQPGSAAVVQSVASDKYAIGYSGIGYKTADVREVPLKATAADEPISATPEFAYTGKYPLSRFLYIYVNLKPGTELDPLRKEFLLYVLSKDGQSDVIKDGYFPVNAKIAGEELAKLGVTMKASN